MTQMLVLNCYQFNITTIFTKNTKFLNFWSICHTKLKYFTAIMTNRNNKDQIQPLFVQKEVAIKNYLPSQKLSFWEIVLLSYWAQKLSRIAIVYRVMIFVMKSNELRRRKIHTGRKKGSNNAVSIHLKWLFCASFLFYFVLSLCCTNLNVIPTATC